MNPVSWQRNSRVCPRRFFLLNVVLVAGICNVGSDIKHSALTVGVATPQLSVEQRDINLCPTLRPYG